MSSGLGVAVSFWALEGQAKTAQVAHELLAPIAIAQVLEDLPRIPPESRPEPEPLPPLPDPNELLEPSLPSAPQPPEAISEEEKFEIERYEVLGSTVFDEDELAVVTQAFTGNQRTFSDILNARSAVTELYLSNGYITSGAIVPPQSFEEGGVVQIQVIEGQLEDMQINGTQRLNPDYVRSRLALKSRVPLQQEQLLEGLQLLQLDPLIETISADLQAGAVPGTNLLVVTVTEADTFNVTYGLDNNRSPSVGTLRQEGFVTEANLTGLGDRLTVRVNGTSGSREVSLDYAIPINPSNGLLRLRGTFTNSGVIEEPFEVLDISSVSNAYEITVRQPLQQRPTEELAIGLTASHENSQTFLGIADIGGFPLSAGANDEGKTRVSALRFFQEWSRRNNEEVIALRSQFNLGLDVLNATINDSGPDGEFFSWQGQAQWVRLLAPDTTLLVRGGAQLTPDELLGLERFGLGGQQTVRGYHQDQLLTDNALLGGVEVRVPIYRDRDQDLQLQLAPFVDVGHGWNTAGETLENNTLFSVGTGLIFTLTDRFNARLDWGIPLIDDDTDSDSVQESGVYFTFDLSLF
ncbi:MAG: ShlB/FhaC/HecB family hemolysin secretion/activation protein [Leptolyngbya sp. SIOISBB]|nr:ShlB/FhaC/HecB family hemolysin secretion/activation protein [Leptolyngbya sp. SIOISBB]